MIKILQRVGVFFISFSILFWGIHYKFESILSRSTENGLAAFYQADGIIFGLIVAFVIQRQWEIWTNLSNSVRIEIDTIREMWKWSAYSDPEICNEARKYLREYLSSMVSEWNSSMVRTRSMKVDDAVDSMRNMLVRMSHSMGALGEEVLSAFTNLVSARNQRLNFSNEHMPVILKRIVMLADILLIILSLFISVDNIYLDYIFTLAIALLAFALIIVVDDLDNPYRPGTWHLTTEGYETLLKELTEQE